MSNQKTPKQFREEWGISDETFRNYRNRVKELTGNDPVKQVSNKLWVITNEQALLDVMPAETKERKAKAANDAALNSIATEVAGELTNESSEETRPSSAFDSLMSGAAVAEVSIVPVTPQTIETGLTYGQLNGQLAQKRQDTAQLSANLNHLVAGIKQITSAYKQSLEQETEEARQQVIALEDTATVLELELKDVRKAEIARDHEAARVQDETANLSNKVVSMRDFFNRKAGS